MTWSAPDRKWFARVKVGGRAYFIGLFEDEEDAAQAYDRVAKHLHGDKAVLNFPKRRVVPASVQEIRQALRTKRKKGMSSRYRGVSYSSRKERWLAQITHDRCVYTLGWFDDELSAARAYDRAARYLRRDEPDPTSTARLNFPAESIEPASPQELLAESWARFKATTSSKYLGVVYIPKSGKWLAQVKGPGGRSLSVGEYEDEEEAAHARDRAALHVLGPKAELNFPGRRRRSPATPTELRKARHEVFKGKTSSRYVGVSWSRQKSQWRAYVNVDGKRHALGFFDVEIEAAEAHDRAVLRLGAKSRLNFPKD